MGYGLKMKPVYVRAVFNLEHLLFFITDRLLGFM